jgi:hypothetical protein
MYKQINYWVKNYGSGGTGDQRAVQDFMECETTEAVKSLKNELIGLIQGEPDDDMLDHTIGINRKVKYNSYEEWAKLMLLWIAEYKH